MSPYPPTPLGSHEITAGGRRWLTFTRFSLEVHSWRADQMSSSFVTSPLNACSFCGIFRLPFAFQKLRLFSSLIFSGSQCKRPLWIFCTSLMGSWIIPRDLLGRYSKFGAPMGLDAFKCKPTSATAGGLQSHPSCRLTGLTEQPCSLLHKRSHANQEVVYRFLCGDHLNRLLKSPVY